MTQSFSPAFATSFDAQPGPLPPFADEARYLAQMQPGTVPPGNLADLLADTSAQIRRYCGWHIAPVITEGVLLDGSGSTSQRLPSMRVAEILSVDNGDTALDVSSLEWSADGYMRLGTAGAHYGYGGGALYGYGYGGGWTSRLRGVAVTYRHGFDLEQVGSIAALCCALVARSVAAPHGYITQESVGGTTLSYGRMSADDRPGSMTLLEYEQDLLDSYRLPGRRSA